MEVATIKKYRGVKKPQQFLPYFADVPEIVAMKKSFTVELGNQAKAMSLRTQWYAFVKSLELYEPQSDMTVQAREVIARAKNGTLEFVHRRKTDVAEAFKRAIDAQHEGLSEYDQAIKAGSKE